MEERTHRAAAKPSDAASLGFAQPKALGRKVSDEFTVPLCRAHHREVHRTAKEINWWKSQGIAPLAVAETLWQHGQSGRVTREVVVPKARRSKGRRDRDDGVRGSELEQQLAK